VAFYSFEKNDVESLHFYHNSLMHFFQSELNTNVKMCYSRQWSENVQMHLCTFTMAHRELMHLCITLNGCTSATVSNITFSLLPVVLCIFSVQYGIKTARGAHVRLCTFNTQPTCTQLIKLDNLRLYKTLQKRGCLTIKLKLLQYFSSYSRLGWVPKINL